MTGLASDEAAQCQTDVHREIDRDRHRGMLSRFHSTPAPRQHFFPVNRTDRINEVALETVAGEARNHLAVDDRLPPPIPARVPKSSPCPSEGRTEGPEVGRYISRINQNDSRRLATILQPVQRVANAPRATGSLRALNTPKEPQYASVSSKSWEVPNDRVSLLCRIGGGQFGEVWKGLLDTGGATGRTPVAIKMLKGVVAVQY